jgi:7-keto-8-aminopelargonate synthetase-like enzyme
VFSDELNHASLIDGCRLSRAEVHVYPHADVDALASLLNRHRASAKRALIITDGLFSMDGDYAPLAEIVELAGRYDAWTYVDDAHAIGVVGDRGRGSIERAGLLGAIDVTVGTLGKAFGASGAFVCGSRPLIQYLINKARSFIFSTGMLPANAAAAREALRIIASEPERLDCVHRVATELHAALAAAGVPVAMDSPASHIIPVPIGDDGRTVAIGRGLAERGFLVGAIRPPTVREGEARLRITASAAHSTEQVRQLVQAVASELACHR